MNTTPLRLKVIEEIHAIPEEKLREIYDVIHFFRVGVASVKPASHNKIMSYARCWDDMPHDMFDSLLHDISARRAEVFSGRTHREALIS